MVAESGGLVQGRLRFGWMDGVKVASFNRGVTAEAARQYAKDIGKSGELLCICN